jgi:hypothetical protein
MNKCKTYIARKYIYVIFILILIAGKSLSQTISANKLLQQTKTLQDTIVVLKSNLTNKKQSFAQVNQIIYKLKTELLHNNNNS